MCTQKTIQRQHHMQHHFHWQCVPLPRDTCTLAMISAKHLCMQKRNSHTHTSVASAPCCSYRADGLPDDEDMVQQYSTIAAALAPHVDLLLCETLSTVKEVRCATTAAQGEPHPAPQQPLLLGLRKPKTHDASCHSVWHYNPATTTHATTTMWPLSQTTFS